LLPGALTVFNLSSVLWGRVFCCFCFMISMCERWRKLPEAKQMMSGRIRIQTRGLWLGTSRAHYYIDSCYNLMHEATCEQPLPRKWSTAGTYENLGLIRIFTNGNSSLWRPSLFFFFWCGHQSSLALNWGGTEAECGFPEAGLGSQVGHGGGPLWICSHREIPHTLNPGYYLSTIASTKGSH
jgi:hypothetical protein